MRSRLLFRLLLAIACALPSVCLCQAVPGPVVTYDVLYNFCSQTDCADGIAPITALIQGSDGNFYGATAKEIYKVSSSGSFGVFYAFCTLTNCPDGNTPQVALIEGLDGAFYGVNGQGGANASGTIFKITAGGVFSVLHTFCSQTNCTDGSLPLGGLIQDASGNFYGTTSAGGANNQGSIYELSANGTYSVLHSFCGLANCHDGNLPVGNLLIGSDGNFYGVTSQGGVPYVQYVSASGTFYQFTSQGAFNVLHSFCQNSECTDGEDPAGGLVEGSNGNYNGVTGGDGGCDSCNVLFSFTNTGAETTPVEFCPEGACDVGAPSTGNLFLGSDGYLYGVTAYSDWYLAEWGGIYNTAPYFGQFGLYQLCACNFGGDPAVGVVQGADGSFYGATTLYGADGGGTLYKLTNASSGTLPGPVQLSFSPQSIEPGASATLSWNATNAFSQTMQQCVANASPGAGAWSGLQAGTASATGYAGTATFAPSQLGTYNYALTCGGIESGFASLYVTSDGKLPSSTTVTATPNPVTIGQPALLTATVGHPEGATAAAGTVTFYSYGATLGTAQVVANVATLSVNTAGFRPGTYEVTASYMGDAHYEASSSATTGVTLAAQTIATTTSLTISPASPFIGDYVELNATVKPASGDTPTGNVAFYYGPNMLAMLALSGSGQANLTVPTNDLPAKTYTVSAVYEGVAPWYGSSSETKKIVLGPNPATITFMATPHTVIAGNEVTLNAFVDRAVTGAGATGPVVFSANGVALVTVQLNVSGTAATTISTVGIPPGQYLLVATYQGDAADLPATSAAIPITVQTPSDDAPARLR